MNDNDNTHEFVAPEVDELVDFLPGYEILSFIAKGGMGAVYLARQVSLDREVAIKILPSQLAENDEFRTAFEKEAKSMAKFNHPNLIGIYDFGQKDGLLYLIMEMVHGNSLYYSAYGKIIEPGETIRIVIGICRGLAAAHDHGILHRDIKPANILLDPSAVPKIGDFGLARATGDSDSETCFGTPGYTAPEVVYNPTAIDESTDIYSVGIMLYELLTGAIPGETYVPAASQVQCSPGFDTIILKAIHHEPAMRYRNANAMADELEKLANNHTPASRLIVSSPEVTGRVNVSSPARPLPGSTPVIGKESSHIGRNLFIIAGLLAAIFFAWKGYEKAQASHAAKQTTADQRKEQERVEREQEKEKKRLKREQERAVEAARLKAIEDAKLAQANESPADSLARLRDDLMQGRRDELPVGTLKKNGRARFFVDQPMSWHEAQSYCEQHGGHLPVFIETAELFEFCDQMKHDQKIWLGAGTSGDENWTWIDGSEWKHAIRGTSKSAYVSVDSTGVPIPLPASEKCAFYIEWNMSGGNPGSIKKQLERVHSSSGKVKYPAGTIGYDGHHYLLVRYEADWQTAVNLAKTAGGTLAVPSTPDENEWILNYLKDQLSRNESSWIGGHRASDGRWKWLNNEPWTFGTWSDGNPDVDGKTAAACTATQAGKWDDVPQNSTPPALLIEWRNDGKNNKQNVGNKQNSISSGATEMRKKCTQLLDALKRKHIVACKNNIRAYEQAIRTHGRRVTQQQSKAEERMVKLMTKHYVGHLIPKDIPRGDLSIKLAEILTSYLKKQDRLEKNYLLAVDSLRAKYSSSLQEKAKEHHTKGLVTLKREIDHEIKQVGKDAKSLIQHITGKEHQEPMAFAQATAKEESGLARGWKITASSAHHKERSMCAIDGNPKTIWNSSWKIHKEKDKPPHTLDISFGEELSFSGISMLPRQKGDNGMIKEYAIYTRNGGDGWSKVHTGEFPQNRELQRVFFNKTVTASELRLKVISSHVGEWGSVAEIDIIE